VCKFSPSPAAHFYTMKNFCGDCLEEQAMRLFEGAGDAFICK
jgi:hypothetical protein